jgi:hypothetical protein
MDTIAVKAWFVAQSDTSRVIFLLKLVHWLSVDFRNISATAEPLIAMNAAKKLNELYHRLAAYSSAVLSSTAHYPDDIMFDFVIGALFDPALQSHVQYTWTEAFRFVDLSPPPRLGDDRTSN